jgi:hypothetical protein
VGLGPDVSVATSNETAIALVGLALAAGAVVLAAGLLFRRRT